MLNQCRCESVVTAARFHELTVTHHHSKRVVDGLGRFAMALPNLIQQSLSADRFHTALISPKQHIDDGFAAVADDLNITGQQQLPGLTVEGEGDRSVRIDNSGAILLERCPDAYLTPVRVEGPGERDDDAGVFAPTFGAAVGALLGAVVVQQNDAAAEWLADDLAEVSEQFTARKIVFMAPARLDAACQDVIACSLSSAG